MKTSPITKFLSITFLISWLAWGLRLIMINADTLQTTDLLSRALMLIGGFGPTIAAFWVVPGSLRTRWHYFFGRTRWHHFPYFAILMAALVVIFLHFGSPAEGHLKPLLFFVSFIIMTLFTGGNEEVGWRGILQPALELRLSFLAAIGLTWAIWMLWHLPLALTGMTGFHLVPLVQYLALGLVLSVLLAWAQWWLSSSLFPMLIHGWINTCMTSFQVDQSTGFWVSLSIICLIVCWDRWHHSPHGSITPSS